MTTLLFNSLMSVIVAVPFQSPQQDDIPQTKTKINKTVIATDLFSIGEKSAKQSTATQPLKSKQSKIKKQSNQPISNEAVDEIEKIRKRLGIALFPDREGTNEFKKHIGQLMRQSSDLQPTIETKPIKSLAKQQTNALVDPSPHLGSSNSKTTPQVNKSTNWSSLPRSSLPRASSSNRNQQNYSGRSPVMSRQPLPNHRSRSSTISVSEQTRQTIQLLHDSVGELDKTALMFEKMGDSLRAASARKISKKLRKQIQEAQQLTSNVSSGLNHPVLMQRNLPAANQTERRSLSDRGGSMPAQNWARPMKSVEKSTPTQFNRF